MLGKNLQYLRKLHGGMTQEKLAERMGVTRQTVSRWESDEVYPEVNKLLEMCDVFSCKLDELLREDMAARQEAYSPVRIERVPGFRMARYVMITPNCENDVNAYMDAWAQRSGLMDVPGASPRKIGWDFPFVSPEQKNRFGLRGYVAAWVLPDGFTPRCGGAEIASQGDADYAVVTIRDPFAAPFERIPGAYRMILKEISAGAFKEPAGSDILPCFEWVHAAEGVECMDVFVHVSR